METAELLQLLAEAGILDADAVAEAQKRNAQCQRLIMGLLKRRPALR